MIIVQDGLRFCSDCAVWAINADISGIDYFRGEERAKLIQDKCAAFGPHLVYDSSGDGEADTFNCDCCGDNVFCGPCCGFAVLGEDPK